jgi:hypothetical protein
MYVKISLIILKTPYILFKEKLKNEVHSKNFSYNM